MLRFVLKLEMGLIYMDAAVSSLLLIVGAVRFLQKSREVNTMTKSEFREAFAEGFFGAMRLHYDLLRAPFVICAAFINDEPSPLRRVRNEEPRQFPPPSQTPATNN